MSLEPRAGRRCHNTLNPLHSALWFSPELEEELVGGLGLADAPTAYVAGRSAPMGAVGAGAVTAAFYNFSYRVVGHAVPAAWEAASPEKVLAARLRAADRVLTRLLGGPEAISAPEVAEAAALAARATEACAREARPLYAANADLPAPEQPHLALWHAATLLREHRGDAHLAALAAAELDGLEALVTHTATGKGFTPAYSRATRGWTEDEWAAAQDRLRDRGLLDAAGELTEAGTALRRDTEQLTDRLDRAPYEHLGAAGTARLTELAGALTATALAAGAFPLEHFGKG
jgi:hypothetical protein